MMPLLSPLAPPYPDPFSHVDVLLDVLLDELHDGDDAVALTLGTAVPGPVLPRRRRRRRRLAPRDERLSLLDKREALVLVERLEHADGGADEANRRVVVRLVHAKLLRLIPALLVRRLLLRIEVRDLILDLLDLLLSSCDARRQAVDRLGVRVDLLREHLRGLGVLHAILLALILLGQVLRLLRGEARDHGVDGRDHRRERVR